MSLSDRTDTQPNAELEWLMQFFIKHGRQDLAKEIHDQLKEGRADEKKTRKTAVRPDLEHLRKRLHDLRKAC